MAATLLLAGLASCTSGGSGTTDSEPTSPTASSPEAPSATPEPKPTPTTERQRRRAALRAGSPDAEEVIALAKTPMTWTKGKGTLLLQYGLMNAYDWPTASIVSTIQVLDRRGRVLGQWVDTSGRSGVQRDYWPAGRHFVGVSEHGGSAVLIQDGSVSPLSRDRRPREAQPGDIRFGLGWLLDLTSMSLARERIEGCRKDSIRNDSRGRIWCLDASKEAIRWSDDGARTWARHELSTSYIEACDGGARGAELDVRGDVVAIGMWRADFSLDRGRTWQDVSLPFELVGAHRGDGGSFPNCTQVQPLADGRLVLEYFGVAIAVDATNTRFMPVRTPPRTRFAGVYEGVAVAASRRPYGERFVSFDGAVTWQKLRVGSLVRHLLPR
jgi:hypothetical protein